MPAANGPRAPRHRFTGAPRWLVSSAVVVVLIGAVVAADYYRGLPADADATYVGRDSCVDCHRDQEAAFAGSHHDKAMALASDQTVLGDFDDARLEHDGIESRMFRDGDRFMVHTEGETGELEDFEVKYVFGVEPLQQYMVEFDRDAEHADDEVSRVQVLRISWDTQRKRWFYLRPPDVSDKLQPDDPLHWTGVAQRWQTMCADCHSTDLEANFDPQRARYHTTFSEINVSCEACHGPGSLHVELAKRKSLFWDRQHGYGLAKLKGDDPEGQLHACAPCHSRRGVLDDRWTPGQKYHDFFQLELPTRETYFDDGQIKDEVYEYGSFIQSKMYHKGIRCSDCHDPHSLQLKHSGNETCTSCHQHPAGKYDVPSHHHHQPGSPGAQCVNCHMPGRTYMEVDFRRDHSFRVPRPDLSVQWNLPNACTACHIEDRIEQVPQPQRAGLREYADWLTAVEAGDELLGDLIAQTDRWCDEACDRWYGPQRDRREHPGEAIAALRSGEPDGEERLLALAMRRGDAAPDWFRATALAELAARGEPQAVGVGERLLADLDEHPMVRASAVRTLQSASPSRARRALLPLLGDPRRLVRHEAAQLLASGDFYQALSPDQRTQVDLALREVRTALMVTADRGGAHMAWAGLCEQRGLTAEAIDAYTTAMRVEPQMAGPRTNLAALMDQLAQRGDRRAAARAEQLRAEELPLLARDADLAPEHAPIQYRYGLALYLSGDWDAALQRLKRAQQLAPEVEDYALAVRLLRQRMAEEDSPTQP